MLKIYQAKSFNTKIPKEIDLKFARKAKPKECLAYLGDQVPFQVVKDTHKGFENHLDDKTTQYFRGSFGGKFENNDEYNGWYAYNQKTKNYMVFRDNPQEDTNHSLYSYGTLSPENVKFLIENHKLFY